MASPQNSFPQKAVTPLLFLMIVLGLAYAALSPSDKRLPDYGEVPPFTLTDSNAAEITRERLAGKVWVADIIFTRCAGICPAMSLRMQKLAKELKNTMFVSFTTDPGYDSPSVLAKYAEWYEADTDRWFFLTGSGETLNRVVTSFKMSPVDDPAMHSSYFVLVDKKNRIRGLYDSNDAAAMKRLRRDAKRLLAMVY